MSASCCAAWFHGTRLLAPLLAALFLALPGLAQDAAPPPPAQVHALLDLLADPTVRTWIEQQRAGAPPAVKPSVDEVGAESARLAAALDRIRASLRATAAALPGLPDELALAFGILRLEFEEEGLSRVLLLIAGFALLGFVAEWLLVRACADIRRWLTELSLDSVRNRLIGTGTRLGFAIARVAAFAAGSLGFFLALSWPPLLREVVVGYLAAFLVVRLAAALGVFLFAPPLAVFRDVERYRVVPMDTAAAWFWQRRLVNLAAVIAFGWVTIDLLTTLGVSPEGRGLVANAFGLSLLGLLIEAAWRRPDSDAPSRRLGRRSANGVLTATLALLWLLWAANAVGLFALFALLAALPPFLAATRRSVAHILRPTDGAGAPAIAIASVERGLRVAILIGAAVLLARAWNLDLGSLAGQDTALSRLLAGAMKALIIVLIADFGWQVLKTMIDHRLGAVAITEGAADSEEAKRGQRLRTLLPILRNIAFVVLVVIVALTALSSLGIEIGPLIAGAGVVGVAVGFGAQTLVKDVISGMFYLLDDAFRVGEYIESGSYKGTVESFSLRSVKLRHHRGPLTTVPFGELGAVQNMSRDWVINKLSIGVTYDTDIDKVKPIIKKIGKALAAEPEFAPYILEPLKMQGVEKFGDFAIEIRLKMMTKPGKQFAIRRKAFALIKKAFDENGIKFAYPTVQVAGGGGDVAAAAAREGLARLKPEETPPR